MSARFLFGTLALIGIAILVLSWRSGRIANGVRIYNADGSPIMYGLTFVGDIFIIALIAAQAAGYSPSEVLDLVGLGWLNAFRHAGGGHV